MAYDNILLVGCGNMAGAMLDGWLAAGIPPSRFTAVSPSMRTMPDGVKVVSEVPTDGTFDTVMIGVKPQKLKEVAPSVEPIVDGGVVLVSILAGVDLAVLKDLFPRAAAHARVMPNLAVALGKSPMAVAADGLHEAGQGAMMEWLQPLGTPEMVDEADFDLVTALAGSGPGFVYRFIDAMAAAAAELGLPADKAGRLAVAMTEGASALASVSPHDPGELARRVASPGGVTQAGLDALDDNNAIRALMTKTLRAARDRSAEMAAEARAKN